VIGGNIATGEAALALVEAGADAVKVGIGPGSICTTRIVAGVGVPQIMAIDNVAKALRGSGVPLIADGGIRYSGDMAKAIVAGAHCVMMGGMPSPAPKRRRARSSCTRAAATRATAAWARSAPCRRAADRYFQDNDGTSNPNADKLVPEGIEGQVPYKGSVVAIIHQMAAACARRWATAAAPPSPTCEQGRVRRDHVGRHARSHVHDVQITKEAPNYRME
jgi:IMP dehydrogenase